MLGSFQPRTSLFQMCVAPVLVCVPRFVVLFQMCVAPVLVCTEVCGSVSGGLWFCFRCASPLYSCWRVPRFVALFQMCVAPVLVCTEVYQTAGGGDNISSAGLVPQIL